MKTISHPIKVPRPAPGPADGGSRSIGGVHQSLRYLESMEAFLNSPHRTGVRRAVAPTGFTKLEVARTRAPHSAVKLGAMLSLAWPHLVRQAH